MSELDMFPTLKMNQV